MATTTITHTVRLSWSGGTGAVSGSVAATADAEDNRIVSVPASASAFQVDIDFSTGVTSFYAMSSRAMSIVMNSTLTTAIIALTANVPYWYNKDVGHTCPFSTGVSAFYLTNGSTLDAQVDLRVLYDSTPTTA